jgi:hypothetical protein
MAYLRVVQRGFLMTGHLVVMTDQVQTAVITDDFMMTCGSCRGVLRRRTLIEVDDNVPVFPGKIWSL